MTSATPKTMHVIATLRGGGAERLLTNIVLQQNAPDRTCVVTLLPGGVFRATLENAGFTVIDLGMQRQIDALRGVFRLAALMRARAPEIVQGWMYHANLMAFFALRLSRLRDTRLVWGTFCTDIPKSDLPLSLRIVRSMNAFFSRYVDTVVYNGEEVRDFHRRIGFRERNAVVISNCIDPEIFRHDLQKRQALRRELGIGDDKVVIAVVARVDPMKDWPTVREAVRDLPDVITIAVGKGTDELPPQDGFIGLGWYDDVAGILSAADIFLLGSAFGEGTSLALGEAMLCGLPCVVTDVGDNAALVGDAGIVVEPRNTASMRAAIVQLAGSRAQREALGRMARQRAAVAAVRQETIELHAPALASDQRATRNP
jgi:glycosyltransferase involved in cell wall biosynthesis